MSVDILALLEQSGALLEGHFLLTSGKHSSRYIEKFRLIEQPHLLDKAAEAMIAPLKDREIDVVLGAAVGGILLAGALARILNARTMFTERVDGTMSLRRGFELRAGEKVLVVEDIVTTGGSLKELIEVTQRSKATLADVVYLVDRSENGLDLGEVTGELVRLPIPAWEADECPLCQEGQPLTQRGRSGKGSA